MVGARARNFDSAIEASLFPDRIPVAVYDNLLSGIEAMRPAMKKYMELRKKKLGLDEVHLYDLYVSIVDDFDMKLTYPEAFQVVKKGLAPLGEHYAQLLDEAYNNHWIDVYENRGKHSGAYSWGTYGAHPYVLMNFIQTSSSSVEEARKNAQMNNINSTSLKMAMTVITTVPIMLVYPMLQKNFAKGILIGSIKG